jgi:hypothetical protein
MTIADLPGERLLPGSPFEELLFILRRKTSAQPSREVSDIERLTDPGDRDSEVEDEAKAEERIEEDSSEMIDRFIRETRSVEAEAETEPRANEQEEERPEPDTEHEEIGITEDERFGLQKEVDEKVLDRMRDLAKILTRGSETIENANVRGRRFDARRLSEDEVAIINNFKKLMKDFERDEIQPERFTEVTLDDPILLLLAQHRCFRICRSEFLCPVQDCRPHKLITSLGRLATHLQAFHNAIKERTEDMIRYFIIKLLSNPIQAIFTTRGGHRVKGRRCHCGCHSP